MVGGRWFLRLVAGGSFGRWSVIFYVSGRWSVVDDRWSVSLWSVAGQWVVLLYYTVLSKDKMVSFMLK